MRTAYSVSVLAVLACLLAAAPVRAEVINLKADAQGSNEVPPNSMTGSGTLAVTYDTATKVMSWKGSYTGLSGPVTGVHLHGPASPAQNAGIMIAINPPGSSFEGSATLTDAQANDMLAGRWYLNVHTDAHKGGEVRGQLLK